MKRLIILSVAATLSVFIGYSQNTNDLEIKDLTLELKDDGSLYLDLDIDLSQIKVRTTQVVVLTPAIINGADTLTLKSIGIYGRNRRIFYQRNEEIKPTGSEDINLATSELSQTLKYASTVAYADWMNGCKVELLRRDFGCCGDSANLGRKQLVDRFPLEAYYPGLIYLKPAGEVIKTREINGSAFIDFPVNITEINPNYRRNAEELSKITSTIDSVRNDKDIIIKSIFIKGYASPESPFDNNARLAQGRTEALKEYVEGLYHFGEGFIKTDFEAEDWKGLEKYVMASTLAHRDEILQAIRSDREPDAKEWIIKSRWKEDYRFLLDNCYPALRHSDYTIHYEIKRYSTPEEIEPVLRSAPQNLSLEEFYILVQSYESGSEEFNDLFETAVRMYPDDPVANLNAANSAIIRKDYRNALRYLEKASDLPEASYARAVLEIYMDNSNAAKPYLEEAQRLGVSQAGEVLKEISVNRNIYKMNNQ